MRKCAKRLFSSGFAIVMLYCMVIVAYAISRLFYSQSVTSDFSKKKIFEFDLNTSAMQAEVGPGDSVSVNPVIENSATEKMYVFIEVESPVFEGVPLYEYDVDENWILVESLGGNEVFAYARDTMTMLNPGECTTALMPSITMKRITNAEYAEIDDINISITGYAIDSQGDTAAPSEVWHELKMIME